MSAFPAGECMLGWTGGEAKGWGSGSKARASKGICSLSKEMSAPELLRAKGLICNLFSSIHTSAGTGGTQHPQAAPGSWENPQCLAAGAAMETERESLEGW